MRLCINCLRSDYFVANCRAGSCRECGQRRNTLCHQDKRAASSTPPAKETKDGRSAAISNRESSNVSEETSSGPSVHYMRQDARRKQVLMSPAIVNAKGNNGYNCQLRVLLDSASETNFVTLAACKKLGLSLDKVCELVNGLGNMNCTIKHSC